MATKKVQPAPPPAPPLTLLPGGSLPLYQLIDDLDKFRYALLPNPTYYGIPPNWPSRLSVPIGLIVAGRWQPRSVFVDAETNELAESIKEYGILNPLLVFVSEHGKLELIAGERRLRAAQLLGLSMVPVDIREGTPAQFQELSLIDNVQRANLKPWEEGQAFEKMIQSQGISEADLARKMGKNRAYIQQRRALANASPALLEALSQEKITLSIARGIIAGAGDRKDCQTTATAAVLEQLKKGKAVNEADAKKIAGDARTAWYLGQARKLGWSVYEHYSGKTYLWGGDQRPQVLESKADALIQIVDQQQRPSGSPPEPWVPDDDYLKVLHMRGLTRSGSAIFAPWVAFTDGETSQTHTFYTGSEIPNAARGAMEDIDAQAARAKDLGWDTRRDRDAVYFVKDDQCTRRQYTWLGTEKLIEQLQEGTAQLDPRDRCWLCVDWIDTGEWMWLGNARIHVACKDAALDAERQQIISAQAAEAQATAEARSAAIIPDWITAIPDHSLRILSALISDAEYGFEEPIAQLRHELLLAIENAEEDWGEDLDTAAGMV